MQQYNSWNSIVWRIDPDPCDVSPNEKARGVENIEVTDSREPEPKEIFIRPTLASIAGAMLMLNDKTEVYQDESILYGLRSSSPVLFSVPDQLYDFDSEKTDWLKEHERTEMTSGKIPTPIDADLFGEVCPYWLNEFNTPYSNWNVLHRLNWTKKKRNKLKAI